MSLVAMLKARHLTLRLLCACLCAVLALIVSPRAPLAAVVDCNPVVSAQGPDGWVAAPAPTFTDGTQTLLTYAVAPNNPSEMFVTNGVQLGRSRDGGCTWSMVYDVGSTAAAGVNTSLVSITQIVVANDGRIYLLLLADLEPKVIASGDGGTTWAEADTGVLPADPVLLAPNLLAAAGTPGVMYLDVHNSMLVTFTLAANDILYVTRNGGASWTPVNVPAPGLVAAAADAGLMPILSQLVVDPADDKHLWAIGGGYLVESKDGGATWHRPQVGDGSVYFGGGAIEASRSGDHTTIAVFDSGSLAYVSDDGGQSWDKLASPGGVTSAVSVAGGRDLAVLAGSSVYRLDPKAMTWSSLWDSGLQAAMVTSDGSAQPHLRACTCGNQQSPLAIWTYTGVRGARTGQNTGLDVSANAPPTGSSSCVGTAPQAPTQPNWGDPRVSPQNQQVVLAPGQTRTVHYRLDLPPEKMQIYFMPDGGFASEFSTCPFKWGVLSTVTQMTNRRNLAGGLGDYGDYSSRGSTPRTPTTDKLYNSGGTVVYQLFSPMAPINQTFFQAVRDLPMSWDDPANRPVPSTDQASLAATYQAVTGEGQIDNPQSTYYDTIRGGQHARFDKLGYRVIVDVATTWFNEPSRTPGYPGPTWASTIYRLQAFDVHQVGIAVDDRRNKFNGGFSSGSGSCSGCTPGADLAQLAGGSGTTAPAPVDCLGDRMQVIPAGKPLVCSWLAPVQGDNRSHDPRLGLEMRNLLMALRDPEPVRLTVMGGQAAVARVTPGVYSGVEQLVPGAHGPMDFDVTFTCGGGGLGQTPVQLGGQVGKYVLATTTATVICGTPAVPGAPPPPPGALLPAGNPVPVPHTLPANAPNLSQGPAQAPQPQVQPQPVAQGQAQAVPNAVAAPEHQTEPQVAVAWQTAGGGSNEYAMSALEPVKKAAVVTGSAAILAGMALGVAWALRAPATGYSWATRRRRRSME
jgi:hypothetical protein